MKNVTYSPFAKLGKLSQYHLQDLVQIASKMSFQLKEDSLYKIAEWSNENTTIVIRFHLDGTFDQLIKEVWKEEELVINYDHSFSPKYIS